MTSSHGARNGGGGARHTPPRHLYGIVGSPVGHSISPALHTWGYARCGHPGAYFAFDKTPGELPEFLRAARSLPIEGLSVTIPHKESVIPFLDGLTERARAVGAVNTLFWGDGGLTGDNTDVHGFASPLTDGSPAREPGLPPLPARALVLGAGGACRAVLAGLARLGVCSIHLCARNPEKAAALAKAFACTPLAWDEREKALAGLSPCLVVNTTPLGMRGKNAGLCPLSPSAFESVADPGGCIVYDIVYTPRETPLLRLAKQYGIPAVDGLPFLVAQGIEQFRIWTGQRLDFAEALAFMEQKLHTEG